MGPVKVTARPPGRMLLPRDLGPPIPPEQAEAVIRLVGGADAGTAIPPHPRSKDEMRWAAHVVGSDGREIPRGSTRSYRPSGGSGQGILDGWSDLRLREVSPDLWVEAFDAKTADDEPLPYAPVRMRPAEGAPTEFVLPPERAIEGRVVGPDGEGVPDVLVLASPDWWRGTRHGSWPLAHSTARTDRSGAFRIGRLADTEYDLEVRPPPWLSRGAGVARAGAKDLTIRLEPTRRSSITVLDDEERPVAGAVVRAGPKGAFDHGIPWPPGVAILRGVSDAEGLVTFGAADPTQTHDLVVDPPSGRPELKSPPARLWRGEDLTVRLLRRWWIRGVVRTPSGEPAPDATLWRVETAPARAAAGGGPSMGSVSTRRGVPLAPDF
jgi:hypothetical protein